MKCQSLYPKKCDGELVINERETNLTRGGNLDGGPMPVKSVRCNKCSKLWTREALAVEGLNADDLHYSAQ